MIEEIIKAPDGTFVWIDLIEPSEEELNSLMHQYALHKTSIQDCLDSRHLPKYEKIDIITFIVLRSYDEKCAIESNTIRELTRKVAIFFTDNMLITIRRVDQEFFAGLLKRWSMNKDYSNLLPRILISIFSALLNTYEMPITNCQDHLEEFEDKLIADSSGSGLIRDKFIEKRKAEVFKRMLKLMLDILPKLKPITEYNMPLFQDLKEKAEGLHLYADDLIDHVDNLINLHLSLASHNTNVIIRTLTIFSVFFMPLTFIVGIFGMNFKYMPELEFRYGYPVVLFSMIFICAGLMTWFIRRKWIKFGS